MRRDRLATGIWTVAMTAALSGAGGAQDTSPELAAALRAEHVTLASGIKAAATVGKPISAKYEYEDGKLQLSVYTERGGGFSEVIIDHKSGKIAKTKRITEGDDLKKAQTQSAAAGKSRPSLATPLEKALTANKGYSAVSVTPALRDGKPVAQITLIKGSEFKNVVEPLD